MKSKSHTKIVTISLVIEVVVLVLIFRLLNITIDANFFVAFFTLSVGSSAIYLYFAQRSDSRRDAARIIIQEIRRAEEVIARYKEQGNFQFTKKIIANNSWGKNIHFFVGILHQDELDKISNLYSTGEFLDNAIYKVFEWNFDHQSRRFYGEVKPRKITVPLPAPITTPATVASPPTGGPVGQFGSLEVEVPPIQPNFWNPLFKDVVGKYEPIYHTPIVEKLKRIAGIE